MRHTPSPPLVSVIMPTYNRGVQLMAAIESVLAQTYPAVQLIVVDDGSTDDTSQRLEQVRGRVTILSQSNQGQAAARNLGLQASNGTFITFLDDDDVIFPTKIARQVHYLQNHPDVGLVTCRHYRMSENGHWVSRAGLLPEGQVLSQLVLSDFIWLGAPLLRRECLETVGYFDTTLPWRGRFAEDWDLWLRLAAAGVHFGCVQDLLGAYRLTSIQPATHLDPAAEGAIAVLDKLFARSDLPEAVLALKGRSYAACYLWLSFLHYAAQQWPQAQHLLYEALRHDPDLRHKPDACLEKLTARALSHRVADPLTFIQHVFDHLPANAVFLHSYRNQAISDTAFHLALRCFNTNDLEAGQTHITKAWQLAPVLFQDKDALVEKVGQAAFHFVLDDPARFVANVLAHLPEHTKTWRSLRPRLLGHIHLARAFEGYAAQQRRSTLVHLRQAIRHQPAYLRNRGVLSIFVRSILP